MSCQLYWANQRPGVSILWSTRAHSALRKGALKYIAPSKGAETQPDTRMWSWDMSPSPQVYNLSNDGGERANIVPAQQTQAEELDKFLNDLRNAGRSRP